MKPFQLFPPHSGSTNLPKTSMELLTLPEETYIPNILVFRVSGEGLGSIPRVTYLPSRMGFAPNLLVSLFERSTLLYRYVSA